MNASANQLDLLEIENFFKLVEQNIGVDLSLDKTYLINSRLAHIAQEEGFETPAQLVRHLLSTPVVDIHWQAFEAMTTNETSFFRDNHPFEALKKIVLPALIVRNQSTREINIWSAAASTGQEAYSIVILLRENFPELTRWRIQIWATDISQRAIDKAVLGIYSPLEVMRGLSATQINQHFNKMPNGSYQVNSELCRMIQFRQMNLIRDWPSMPKFDLILMRNVLIYFNREKKMKIIKKLHSQLANAEAYLMLGSSESILFDKTFKAIQCDRTYLYQKRVA